jgi:hypothetical protein
LIWVGKSTLAVVVAETGVDFSEDEALGVEVILVPAFMRPHPEQVTRETNTKTNKLSLMLGCYSRSVTAAIGSFLNRLLPFTA